MESLLKQPNEIKSISIDFSPSLATGETINLAGITLSVKNVEDSSDVTSTIYDTNSINLTDNTIFFRIKAGEDGGTYKITVNTGLTSASNIHEEDILLSVTEDLTLLSTVDEIKRQLEITDNSKDVILFDLVKAASSYAESYTGRIFSFRTINEDFYPESTSRILLLKHFPVYSLVSIVVDGVTTDLTTESVDNFIFDRDSGSVTRVDGLSFPRSPYKTTISYKAGFKSIPEDVKLIVKKMVVLEYNRRKRDGILSETVGNYSVRFDSSTFGKDSDLLKTLKRYKKRLF